MEEQYREMLDELFDFNNDGKIDEFEAAVRNEFLQELLEEEEEIKSHLELDLEEEWELDPEEE